MRTTTVVLLLLVVGVSCRVHADPFSNADESLVQYQNTPYQAALSCGDLVAASSFDFTVVSSTLIEATDTVPRHCRIDGLIPTEIRFEVNLPLAWNGRLYMYGNGGLAGTPASDPARRYAAGQALAHSFATAYTDTGHDKRVQPGGTFAHNNFHKLVDYGFRAVHLTAVSAKSLATYLYGKAPAHSYFNGCSTGGLQISPALSFHRPGGCLRSANLASQKRKHWCSPGISTKPVTISMAAKTA